ncbi:MAG TPA: hypothetical protein VMT88_13560 [Actinomycetes bacterium]|nr:hypothetical protein [Actinomycetes bacterium]
MSAQQGVWLLLRGGPEHDRKVNISKPPTKQGLGYQQTGGRWAFYFPTDPAEYVEIPQGKAAVWQYDDRHGDR